MIKDNIEISAAMPSQKPNVVLFDWDGTLVNTGSMYKNLLQETLNDLGVVDWDKDAAEKYRFHSRRYALPLIFGDKWQQIDAHYVKKIRGVSKGNIKPFSETLELLEYFAQNKIIMAIVSNKEGHALRSEVKSLGWEHYFYKIVGATDAAEDKPSPEPALLALDGLDISDRERIWFLGDSVVDMQCADAIGCVPILFGQENTEHKHMKIPYIHVLNHKQIINLCSKLI